ncbi:MAG: GTP-binding protein [Promethearchaeota archaeon]|nr:MAG: GTP-binding protein [Candidatus Lokiarchaeota archaeon]
MGSEELLKQLVDKFLLLYPDVGAVAITDFKGKVILVEERDRTLSSKIENIHGYFEMSIRNLMAKREFRDLGMGYIDTINFHIFHILVNKQTVLTMFLKTGSSFGQVSPYALFLAEKIAQILRHDESFQMAMPGFQDGEMMFEKYKTQMNQMGFDVGGIFRFKFVIAGDGAVGKTSLVRRFVEDKFDKDYKSTIGLNIVSHNFELMGNQITASLWDVGGQEHFSRFRQTYYLGTQAAFIVFDLTNRKSFENIEYWYNEIKTYGNKPNVSICLVGNKSDLKRKVKFEEGLALADKLSEKDNSLISYVETSAAKGDNVDEAFKNISYLYIVKTKETEEVSLKEEVYILLKNILASKSPLTLAFITESTIWSPALNIIKGLKQLGEFTLTRDEEDIKFYQYDNGLILKNFNTKVGDLSDCDGIFIFLDAQDREHIDQSWFDLLGKVAQSMREESSVFIGLRVKEDEAYSRLITELDIDEEDVLFFKLGDEFQLIIYEQLKNMLNNIKFSIVE